jgi:hypothetical protein
VLVNFFYAHPVGHAVEALHYCVGHHVADPAREISVALNAATAVELADFCPFVAHTYAIHHPLLEPCPDSAARQASIPAGSGPAALYPSRTSWLAILGALAEAFPRARVALIGKRTRDERTATSFGDGDLAALLAHPSRPVDCFDLPLAEQLAIVEGCDLFLSPHTGFGLAALAVDTRG